MESILDNVGSGMESKSKRKKCESRKSSHRNNVVKRLVNKQGKNKEVGREPTDQETC